MTWPRLVAAIPWLGTLPTWLTDQLDLTELVIPRGTAADVRAEVEHVLGAHVMTYRPGPHTSKRLQLCQALEPAPLTGAAVSVLRTAEAHLHGIVLCAYTRPLRIRPTAHRTLQADDNGLSGSSAPHTQR